MERENHRVLLFVDKYVYVCVWVVIYIHRIRMYNEYVCSLAATAGSFFFLLGVFKTQFSHPKLRLQNQPTNDFSAKCWKPARVHRQSINE